jgi:hypothetical protein
VPVPEFFCHEFCDQHDFNYWLGGSEEDRHKADDEFLAAMLKAAGDDGHKQTIAFTYWMAVRLFGSMCFNYAEKERDENDLARALSGDAEAIEPHHQVKTWKFGPESLTERG